MIDSHAHLTSPSVLPFLDTILDRALTNGVSHILNICTDAESLHQGLLLEANRPFIKNAGAVTPHDVARIGEEIFPLFESAAREKKLCAIGETGLDYHYAHSSKEIQKRFLERYLHLASSFRLPIIFHCREAFSDLFAIANAKDRGSSILHCFTGSLKEAQEVLTRGWYLSLSGIVTFKKSEMLREVAKITPLSQLLLETDTPYLSPQSRRGKPNEPSFILEIAQCIASVKGISVQEVETATAENAKKLFGFV